MQLILITNNIYEMSAGGFLQVKDHPIEQQTHPHPGFFRIHAAIDARRRHSSTALVSPG
ncbi:hypothetical protein [Dyella kyungheensis]|uniref:Uncharacterized protein n=1 Tax=Dyella kyungheensis TaxID=1242174 RepID=A0ABS2JQ51_9GAMM|nr:hypothetical protein [Dyella kyungheensis]MBM7120709.1 hypothetical protein [Dyella kyungheensis]